MGKNPDKICRTSHPFMIKKIIDDKDDEGGARLIGTFVQQVYDLNEAQIDKVVEEQTYFFGYRFNEVSAKEDEEVHVRRTETLTDKKTEEKIGARTTVEVNIPLEIDSLVSCFPFKVYLATATIELSSTYTEDGQTTIRSDILVHKDETRNNISIQNKDKDDTIASQFKSPFENCKKSDEWDHALDRMDKSKKYNLLTPYPEVYYEWDNKKGYCPRFIVQFYLVDPGFYKLVSTLLPMILVLFVAALNVWNDWVLKDENGEEHGDETSNHLQVTSALTLTIVFVLPQIVNGDGNRDKLFSRENLNIIMFFFALILASVPYRLSKTIFPELVGVVLMGVSLLLPVYHAGVFSGIQNKMRKKKFNKFLKTSEYKPEKKIENFRSVGDMLDTKDFDEALFDAKNLNLWWNTCTPKRFGRKSKEP